MNAERIKEILTDIIESASDCPHSLPCEHDRIIELAKQGIEEADKALAEGAA